MGSIMETPKTGHGIGGPASPKDKWSSIDNVIARTTKGLKPTSAPLESSKSPTLAPANLLGESTPDIWTGLEQLELNDNKVLPVSAQVYGAQLDLVGSSQSRDIESTVPELKVPAPQYSATRWNSRESSPLPDVTTEEALASSTLSSGAFHLPPTRDVSTIKPLPSMVFSTRHIPSRSVVEPYVASGSLEGNLAEQQLQRAWRTTHSQWSSTRKRSKYSDASTTYISGPRRTYDARMHELRVDPSGELSGEISANTVGERNKENGETQGAEQPESDGSGWRAFRSLSGSRAGRNHKALGRGRTEERGSGREGLHRGRGYGRYNGRGRVGRGNRGGRGATPIPGAGGKSGW